MTSVAAWGDLPGALPWELPLGALPSGDGRTTFRVWAPRATRVDVVVRGRDVALDDAGHGVFAAEVEAAPGDDYRFRLDGGDALPDPCSRWQPEGLRGPSRILDTRAFRWTDDGWRGVQPADLVIYELHVGTFTPAGTFDAAAEQLPGLRALGITAIELMPVPTFPGERNWGYDGVLTWAPHRAYGGPAGLARLVDAAHAEGLAVLLDVVYNHVGPGSELLSAYGPYFTDRYRTPWGEAINYDDTGAGAVREWAAQNACLWIADYHLDGLRLDAVHAIHDESPVHIVEELAARARAAAPERRVLVVAESNANDPRLIRPAERGGLGTDGVWDDDFHHALHVLLTGERDGYYADFGRVAQLAKALADGFVFDGEYSEFFGRRRGAPAHDAPASRFVVYAQNHDQIGNRALGDRLPHDARVLAAFCTLLSPFVPLLFMGEETGETRPFAFFTDHDDPAIARATREGRRREFEAFLGFEADDVPDPQAPATFAASRLDPAAGDGAILQLHADLLRLRLRLARRLDGIAFEEDPPWLLWRRGRHTVVCNFAHDEVRVAIDASTVVLAGGDVRLADMSLVLGPRAAAVVR